MRVYPEHLTPLFDPYFPIAGELFQLELSDGELAQYAREDKVLLNLRMFFFEADANERQITDIIEQVVYFVSQEHLENRERFDQFMRGWVEAVKLVLAGSQRRILMPQDLASPKVLNLKQPQVKEQFLEALMVRSRLGKYLRPL